MQTYNAIATLKRNKKILVPVEGRPDRVMFDKSIQRELNAIKHQEARRERHEGRHDLQTGGWVEEDQYAGEAPSAAFAADLLGETMPQNPGGFGLRLEVLL